MSNRIRDFGIAPGFLTPGPRNSLSDVVGVTVGHVTLSRPREGVQTGVTAVVPRPGPIYGQAIPAAVHIANGYGKMIGVLTVTNLPGRFDPCALHVPDALKSASAGEANGSIINVVATDASLQRRNLRRLAYRSALGIARTGSSMANGSGDYELAFSTQTMRSAGKKHLEQQACIMNNEMDPLFHAAMEATEEAILNAMAAATTTETSVGRLDAFPFGDIVAK